MYDCVRLVALIAIVWPVLAVVTVSYLPTSLTPFTGTWTHAKPSLSTSFGDGTTVHVVNDSHWFVPGRDGWVCGVQYVELNDPLFNLKLLPRGTRLGKVVVYPKVRAFGSQIAPGFTNVKSYGNTLRFYHALTQSRDQESLLLDGEWIVVATNHLGGLERVLAIEAKCGDSVSFVGMPNMLHIGTTIPVAKLGSFHIVTGSTRVPGIDGADPTVYAFTLAALVQTSRVRFVGSTPHLVSSC